MPTFATATALLALLTFAPSLSAAPARVLFPTSLHLTRQVHDPISGNAVTMDEYCYGNRIVSISGDRTVVVDYEKQEITDIDRRAGTYSVTRFDEIAQGVAEMATGQSAPKEQLSAAPDWKVTPRGLRAAADGRSLEQFEFVDGARGRKIDVGVDRGVALSRDALEVLIGAAYPNSRRDEHEPIVRAADGRSATRGTPAAHASAGAQAEQTYGLPVTQAITYSEAGAEVTFRTTITRVGSEMPPHDALIIPPAAKRVESRSAAVRRQLRELDHLAAPSPQREN